MAKCSNACLEPVLREIVLLLRCGLAGQKAIRAVSGQERACGGEKYLG